MYVIYTLLYFIIWPVSLINTLKQFGLFCLLYDFAGDVLFEFNGIEILSVAFFLGFHLRFFTVLFLSFLILFCRRRVIAIP